MMGKTLLFFTVYPLNQDYYEKYGFDHLKKEGYKIIILNVMTILFPHAVDDLPHYIKLSPIKGVKQDLIESTEQLDRVLQRLRGKKLAILICNNDKKILYPLKINNIDYVLVKNHVHDFSVISTIDKIKIKYHEQNSILKLFKVLLVFFINKTKSICSIKEDFYPPEFIMTRNDYLNKYIDNKKTKLIYVNSFDYDRVIEQGNNKRPSYLPKKPYFVLLVNHPWYVHDAILSNVNNNAQINKEQYKIIINRFLDLLEEKTGTKVLIAAYPKATKEENIYKGRLFIYDTQPLVKYSSGVIGHHTGAMNFAVIFQKPICLIGLRVFPEYSEFSFFNKAYSRELGVPLHHIDTEEDCYSLINGEIFSINPKLYRIYMEKHVVSKFHRDKRIWETVSAAFDDKYWRLKYD